MAQSVPADHLVRTVARTLVHLFCHNASSISVHILEFTMNSTVSARPSARRRWAPIAAGIFALLGSFAVVAPAQAGYYGDPYYGSNPCSYRCGYPAYRYYPTYRRHYGCYSCGSHIIYERRYRYVEREYVERRYGYGGYRRHYGYPYGGYPYGYRPRYGYYPEGGYRSRWQPLSYGYGGVGRSWPAPYLDGSYGDGYEEAPRPPAPVPDEGEY
jgi:hypothetical protein